MFHCGLDLLAVVSREENEEKVKIQNMFHFKICKSLFRSAMSADQQAQIAGLLGGPAAPAGAMWGGMLPLAHQGRGGHRGRRGGAGAGRV